MSRVLDGSDHESLHGLELVLALPERGVPLPGGRAKSKIDVFALARDQDGDLVALGVEGKERETFAEPVKAWLGGDGPGRTERLEYLSQILELEAAQLGAIEYQLLYRTVATVLEAERFGAARAVMLVHSFSGREHIGLEAFGDFAELLGARIDAGEVTRVGERGGVELFLSWVADQPRTQAHSGEPEDVLLDALGWLRDTYRERRFFKERDVEARLQQGMSELFEERRLDWRVYENFRVPGKLLDLAVVDPASLDRVEFGIELKYEPAHARGERDLLARKFPVVIWSEVAKDVEQLRHAVESGAVALGYALLLDEGGYWRARQNPPPFGEWRHWDIGRKDGLDPALLVTRVTAAAPPA